MPNGKQLSLALPLPVAETRWMRCPLNALVVDGRPLPLAEEINTRQAAELLGVTVREVQRKCDEGVLREGIEWRRLPTLGGCGHYKIKLSAIERMRKG